MDEATNSNEQTAEVGDVPRGGMPGDGAGRIEDTGTRHAGVWPVSGPPSGNPDARIHDQASFGQGKRGATGYEDSGESEVIAIPPSDVSERDTGIATSGVGDVGSNAGEVDPGVGGSSETVGETAV